MIIEVVRQRTIVGKAMGIGMDPIMTGSNLRAICHSKYLPQMALKCTEVEVTEFDSDVGGRGLLVD